MKKLTGNQSKLDLNKNGKLDAEDFKMLRGNKMAKGSTVKGGITIHELENRLSEHTQVIDDRTLDSEEIHNWGADNVTEYKKAQNEIDKIKYKGKGWEIYGWYDVSSFDYWIIKQEEQNYIQITIKFKNETVKEEEVDEIADALDSALADADRITNKYNYNPSKFGKGSTVEGEDEKAREKKAWKRLQNGALKVQRLDDRISFLHRKRNDAETELEEKQITESIESLTNQRAKIWREFGFSEDMSYAQGGSTSGWCYSIGGL